MKKIIYKYDFSILFGKYTDTSIDDILSKLALNDIKLNKWVMLTKGNSDVKNNLEENKEE